jgi:hypothetical protein
MPSSTLFQCEGAGVASWTNILIKQKGKTEHNVNFVQRHKLAKDLQTIKAVFIQIY